MHMLKFQNIVLRVSKVTSQAVRTLSKSDRSHGGRSHSVI